MGCQENLTGQAISLDTKDLGELNLQEFQPNNLHLCLQEFIDVRSEIDSCMEECSIVTHLPADGGVYNSTCRSSDYRECLTKCVN